jgi:hypothetical protein
MYYVCPYCGVPLKVIKQPVEAPRRPFLGPRPMFCPYCGLRMGPPDTKRVRLDFWRNVALWVAVTVPVLVIYIGFALWGSGPWAARLLVAVDVCLTVGFPAALVVSLIRRIRARRALKSWRPYCHEGDPPELEDEWTWAA